MPRHSYGNTHHQALEPNGREDIGTEEERGPQQGERNDFDPSGDDAMLSEVSDVLAEYGVMHEPGIHAL